jgi:Ca2+-binding RTX toxin-like protein
MVGNAGDNILVASGWRGLRLEGGDGADTLIGGNGADTLLGDSGADLFSSRVSLGEDDVILDFTPGEDSVLLTRIPSAYLTGGKLHVERFEAALTDTAYGALLSLNRGFGDIYTLMLVGVSVANLSAQDFLIG